MQRHDPEQVTRRLLQNAGLGPNMRVLDVGCGPGTVSLMAAELVGEGGRVVGIDHNEKVLGRARERAREAASANVEFRQADLRSPPLDDGPYDAIVGRRVLKYQDDRHAVLRALAGALKPGGVMAFQELDASMLPAAPSEHPLHRQVQQWIWSAIEATGATTSMGRELPAAFAAAGLELLDWQAEAIIERAAQRSDIAQRVRVLMRRIIDQGIAREHEIDIETLDDRLDAELKERGGAFVSSMVFCGWARKSPSAPA